MSIESLCPAHKASLRGGAEMASRPSGGIDLHTHSTASDGTCTPDEIVHLAADAGLRAISITDHDTLEGSRWASAHPLPQHLHFIAGVEISTQPPDGFSMPGSLHILGYGIDVDDAPLGQALAELQEARDRRIPEIIARLNRIGISIGMDQVREHIGQGTPGRPHIARVLVETGIVPDIDAAFDRYLGKGQPGYVNKYRIECRRAIDLIRQAGGIPVLAHPYLVPCPEDELAGLVATLRDLGLMGIEAYYSEHPPDLIAAYLALARRFGLLVTGGSDFHGKLNPDIRLGSGRGDLHVPFDLYESLVSKLNLHRGD
jgi:predicted metal-dependent phosphoesterase TrpH